MAHLYAGILGLLAFLTSVVRGMIHDSAVGSVLWLAWLSLLAFGVIGYVVGWLAERIVEDSVRGRILAELAAEESAETSPSASADATQT